MNAHLEKLKDRGEITKSNEAIAGYGIPQSGEGLILEILGLAVAGRGCGMVQDPTMGEGVVLLIYEFPSAFILIYGRATEELVAKSSIMSLLPKEAPSFTRATDGQLYYG